MKRILAMPAVISLALTACETMNESVSSGAFDPLRPPGSGQPTLSAASPSFAAGRFVRAVMDNTAFFKKPPKGDADADKLLTRGTSMKVISSGESYVKVELDSGEIGWVPSLMLEDPSVAGPSADPFGTPNPGEFQVYPPTGGYDATLPAVNPAEMPPAGSIPTVIDPDAPANSAPVAPANLPNHQFPATEPAPAEKKSE